VAKDGGELTPERFALIFKQFVDMVAHEAQRPESAVLKRIRAHLSGEPMQLPVIAEEFHVYDHPNIQVALDAYLAGDGRQADLIGLSAENKRFMGLGLSDMLSRGGPMLGMPVLSEGPVDYVNFRLAGDRVLACVQFGLYLISAGPARLVVFVTGASEAGGPRQGGRVEVMATRREDAQAFLRELEELRLRLNVYRGHVISLSQTQFGSFAVHFHALPKIARDDVVLPAGLLESVERHTIGFSQHAAALLAAGRSLKRGLLLYGLPGTGKTLTIMYLAAQMTGRTVILATGQAMGLLSVVARIARALQPSMVVLEDVDLIAEERGMPFSHAGPLLFELLNEMDGLREETDVIFLLTTNRADILEPALAARPGRIDLAVELPLPDADGRRRLFELYARGLSLDAVDFNVFVGRTEGVSPAYIKELLRKAALLAATEDTAMMVQERHLVGAMDELSQGGRLAERILGYRPGEAPPSSGRGRPPQPGMVGWTGYPAWPPRP
jgi:hypothetical protein